MGLNYINIILSILIPLAVLFYKAKSSNIMEAAKSSKGIILISSISLCMNFMPILRFNYIIIPYLIVMFGFDIFYLVYVIILYSYISRRTISNRGLLYAISMGLILGRVVFAVLFEISNPYRFSLLNIVWLVIAVCVASHLKSYGLEEQKYSYLIRTCVEYLILKIFSVGAPVILLIEAIIAIKFNDSTKVLSFHKQKEFNLQAAKFKPVRAEKHAGQRYMRLAEIEIPDSTQRNHPVSIEKGAILLDTASEKKILQLKLMNIAQKVLQSATLLVYCSDKGKPDTYNKDGVEVTYRDVLCQPGQSFGTQQPIPLPAASDLYIQIYVKSVLFEDQTSYECPADEAAAQPYKIAIRLDNNRSAEKRLF